MARDFLSEIYYLDTEEQRDELYSEWAATYDADLAAQGYVTPQRCASALAEFVSDKSQPVLDVGCGTGVSGMALAETGFSNIDGTDINREMLAKAHGRGVYRKLSVSGLGEPLDVVPGNYVAIAAIGVIGTGAAPVEFLHECLSHLQPGNLLVFSYNDHTLARPDYVKGLDDAMESGDYRMVHQEYGPHISRLNIGSNVYVMQRK